MDGGVSFPAAPLTASSSRWWRQHVIDLVREAARAGTTVLAATHDESLADVADGVLHIDDGALVAR